uniref:Putative phosphatase PSR2 n=1 Tax=Lygus hesperus TaxID=30085 RepID=A0A0A9Z0L9_LYGHE
MDKSKSTSHANFYALSRTQTIQKYAYMKYLPMLGRPMKRTLMVDDNVRSFPLNPRHGIKIDSFEPDDHLMQYFARKFHDSGVRKPINTIHAEMLGDGLDEIKSELNRLASDSALLDILPMLRAVAALGPNDDVSRELDH